MTGLFEAATWTLEEPGQPRNYVITGPEGEVLADAVRVPTGKPTDGALPYANPHAAVDESRVLVRVTAPGDDTPLFFVDRVGNPMSEVPRAAIVAPDGSPIGHMSLKPVSGKGLFKAFSRGGRFKSERLVHDGAGQQVCTVVDGAGPQGHDHTISDAQGTEIALIEIRLSPQRRRSLTLKLRYEQLPEPLRTLVIASPLALEISTPVV